MTICRQDGREEDRQEGSVSIGSLYVVSCGLLVKPDVRGWPDKSASCIKMAPGQIGHEAGALDPEPSERHLIRRLRLSGTGIVQKHQVQQKNVSNTQQPTQR